MSIIIEELKEQMVLQQQAGAKAVQLAREIEADNATQHRKSGELVQAARDFMEQIRKDFKLEDMPSSTVAALDNMSAAIANYEVPF